MQALKGFVIGMAILLAVGFGFLAWGLYYKANNPDFRLFASPKDKASSALPAPGVPTEPFGDVEIPLPPNCSIEEMRAKRGRLFLRIGPGEGCPRVIVLDAVQGRVLGVFKSPGAP